MQRIKHLVLQEEDGAFEVTGTTKQMPYLWGLSHLNLFVGANNSGKSRFMRKILETTPLQYLPERLISTTETPILSEYSIDRLLGAFGTLDTSGEWEAVGPWLHLLQVGERHSFNTFHQAIAVEMAEIIRAKGLRWNLQPTRFQSEIDSRRSSINSEIQGRPIPNEFQALRAQTMQLKRLYIPTLRGLRPIKEGEDYYEQATIRDYQDLKGSECKIFTGQTIYSRVLKLLCGKHEHRRRIQAFELFLSEAFFGGDSIALIPLHEGKGSLDIKIGRQKQFPVAQLGDGIQAIIAITFPLFTKEEGPMLVGIEEPEINLHPGMQRTLIDALRRFGDCQFFLATHSNHFLDLTLESDDISVYAFEKHLVDGESDERPTVVRITPVSHGDSRTLQLLGTRNSSVFLSNCTIWVEGITDRRYFSHYLRLYQEHLKRQANEQDKRLPPWFQEDLHFSFVEYAGANITHWSWLDDIPDPIEVERLCGRVMLIADNDDAKEGSAKAERHKALEKKLRKRFILLESREVENLISASVMAAYLEDIGLGNAKALVGTWEGYKAKKLGDWIDKLCLQSTKKMRKHAAKSGTVEDKGAFAAAIIGHTKTFDDLSPEAQSICEKMYRFIKANQDRSAD